MTFWAFRYVILFFSEKEEVARYIYIYVTYVNTKNKPVKNWEMLSDYCYSKFKFQIFIFIAFVLKYTKSVYQV